jgi:anti-sigma B factor antagonist
VIEREHEADAIILTLYGDLDLGSSRLLEGELESAESAVEEHLLIDLSGLAFMDSVGLTVLVGAQHRSLENGHHLSLLRGPRVVHRIFELTDTARLFAFED